MERRRVLRIILGTTAAVELAVFASCAPQSKARPQRPETTPPTSVPKPDPIKPTALPEVTTNYPEATPYPLTERPIELRLPDQTIRILNLADGKVNPNQAAKAYAYFRNRSIFIPLSPYSLNQEIVPFRLSPRMGASHHLLFLIPDQIHYPRWAAQINIGTSDSQDQAGTLVSFSRIHNQDSTPSPTPGFTTAEEVANKNMLRALLNGAVDMKASLDRRTTAITFGELELNGQRVVSESLARAFALRQRGLRFEEYQDLAGKTILPPTQRFTYLPLIVLPKEQYEAIPDDIGLPFSR